MRTRTESDLYKIRDKIEALCYFPEVTCDASRTRTYVEMIAVRALDS